jgi:hypothetical protein
MEKTRFKKKDDQVKNYQKLTDRDNYFKTTNINILLNRVRLEKKDISKKRVIFSISVISIISFLSLILLRD